MGKVTRPVLEKQNLLETPAASRSGQIRNLLMTCPVCGNPYPCVHNGRRTSVLLDSGNARVAETFAGSSQKFAAAGESSAPGAASANADSGNWPTEQAWRQEVTARVQQHRARRRKRYDPNALELDFPAEAPISFAGAPDEFPPPPSF